MPENASPKRRWLEASIFFAAAFALRAAIALPQALWDDEIASRIIALTPFGDLLGGYYRIDPHPPLFHLALKGWVALVGASDIALRLLPICCGALTVALGYLLLARFADRASARIGALLLTLTPMQVWAGTELRAFALLSLLLVAAVYFALAWAQQQRRWDAVGMTACLAASLYTHYYAFFFVAAFYLSAYFLFDGLRQGLRRSMAATLLAFAPWLIMLAAQISHGQFFRRSMSLPDMAERLVWHLPFTSFPWMPTTFIIRLTNMAGSRMKVAAMILMIVATIIAFIYLLRRKRTEHRAFDFVLMISVIVPWLTLTGALLMPLFDIRYLAPYLVFPALAIAFAPSFRCKSRGALLLVLLWLPSLMYALLDPGFRRPDWPWACERTAGQTVLLYDLNAAPAFRHYCGDRCTVEAIYDSPAQIDNDAQIDSSIARIADHELLWLLVQNEAIYDPHAKIPARLRELFPQKNCAPLHETMNIHLCRFSK